MKIKASNGQGVPVNPYSQYTPNDTDVYGDTWPSDEWKCFDKANPPLTILTPNGEVYKGDDVVEGEVVWQISAPGSNKWYNSSGVLVPHENSPFDTRQVYIITQPEPAKEVRAETVEEAASQYAYMYEDVDRDIPACYRKAFIHGAQWQAQNPSLISREDIKYKPASPVSMGVTNGINPCPLCGGKEGESVLLGYDEPRYMITCCNCNLRIVDDRKDKVKGKWNTREGISWDRKPLFISREKVREVVEKEINILDKLPLQHKDDAIIFAINKLNELLNKLTTL